MMKNIKRLSKALYLSALFGSTIFTTQAFAEQRLAATLGPYPGSLLSAPAGNVLVSFNADILTVKYDLRQGVVSSQGGIHIHKGTTCDDATKVGGHYWDADLGEDTWMHTTWESDSKGHSEGTFEVKTGYNYEQNISHAVVIHNETGARIACGILKVEK